MATTAARVRSSLLVRHRNFRLLWLGETASVTGTAVSGVAMPLVAVTVLEADAFIVGLLEAALWIPWLFLGLPAGAVVDRVRSRPVMLICDALGAAALASVPAAAALGRLTLAHLLTVALVSGVRAVFFDPAYTTFLPQVVQPADLPAGNALLQGSESGAYVAGPSLAGVVAAAAGAVTGLLVNAATFVVSAACLLRIDAVEQAPGPATGRPRLFADIRVGLRFLSRDPYLRVLAIAAALQNLMLAGIGTLQVIFLVEVVGVGPATAGLVVAAGGAGGIVGAAIVPGLARWLGSARAMLTCAAGVLLGALLVPLSGPGSALAFFVLGTAGSTAAVVGSNVLAAGFRQRYCPPGLLGRVTSGSQVLAYGTAPVGALLAGVVGSALGLREVLWVLPVFGAAAVVTLLAGPLRHRRNLPNARETTDSP